MLINNLRGLLAAALFVAISSSVVVLAAAPKADPKCPVSGHPCDPDATAAFEGGKVCFCCEKCVKAFEADSEKFAAKARQQLVSTGQFKQSGCPLSGGPVRRARSSLSTASRWASAATTVRARSPRPTQTTRSSWSSAATRASRWPSKA